VRLRGCVSVYSACPLKVGGFAFVYIMFKKSLPFRRAALPRALALAFLAASPLTHAETTTLPQVQVTGAAEQPYAPDSAAVGGKTPVRLLDLPQSVTVFSQERIQDQNLLTLGDLMQQAPGITVMPFDGVNPDFRSRGYSLEIAYDGVPTNNLGSGTQEYDLAIFERVEILRGPSGVTQGSGQPGGVINFVRKRGTRQFQLAGAANIGSWDNRRAEIDIGGPLNSAGTLRARAVATLQDRGFFYDVGHDRKWLGYLALDADIGPDTVVSLTFSRQQDQLRSPSMGLPAYTNDRFWDTDRETHVYPAWNRFFWRTDEVSAEVRQQLAGGWELQARALQREVDKFYRDAYPSTGVNPATMTATYARRMSELDFRRQSADLFASGPFTLWGRRHSATIGYNYDTRLADTLNVTYTAVPNVPINNPALVPEPVGGFNRGSGTQVTQSGLYAQARLSLSDPLALVLGARSSNYRSESRSIAPSPQTPFVTSSRERGEVTPSASLIWTYAPERTAYLSYSDIFLPQSLFDASGKIIEPRVGSQFELGSKLRLAGGKMSASAALFSMRDRNRALATAVPEVYAPAGEVKVYGAEFELGGNPVPSLNLTAGYTWLKTEYGAHPSLSGEIFSTFEPRHTLKLYARYQPAWLSKAFVAAGLNGSSRVTGSGTPGGREQGGYAVASAQAGYALHSKLSLTLSVNNLFDRVYRSRVGGLNTYNIYGEPRNVLLTLRGAY